MLLQRVALRAGDGQVRVPAWLLGTGVPAALRLRARLLQPRHRPLQLRARLPGQELPGALPGGEIRISLCAQVRWRSRGGYSKAAVSSSRKSLRLCLSLWLGRESPPGFEHPRLDEASALPRKKHLGNASRQCCPTIWSSLVLLPMVIKQHIPTQNIL